MLPKTSALKRYDRHSKGMLFFIEDGDLLQKYSSIWDSQG